MAPLRLSLAHLTVLDAHPLELIDAAAAGGFNSVGLRIVAPMPTDRIVPVIGDEALTRQIERKLADTGIDILDVEAIWLTTDIDVISYIPPLTRMMRGTQLPGEGLKLWTLGRFRLRFGPAKSSSALARALQAAFEDDRLSA
jgi:hypothetical protein